MTTEHSPANVFLVPFDRGNFERTVGIPEDPGDPIDLSNHPERPAQLAELDAVRLWGARDGTRNRQMFERMEPDDLLLFYNDKRYVGLGYVGQTFEDTEGWVSSAFWGNAPSRLIYTVVDYEPIAVPRAAMNVIFGYGSEYSPQGLTRVADGRIGRPIGAIEQAIRRYTLRKEEGRRDR